MRNCLPQPGGRFINDLDIRRRRRVAFLGSAVKEEIFGAGEAVGRTMLIMNKPFAVIGVMQPKLQMSSYQGEDKSYIFIPSTTFEAMRNMRYVSDFVFRVPGRPAAERALNEVYGVLARRHRFDPSDRNAISVWDTAGELRITQNIHRSVEVCMGVIGVVTMIVAGVGVANVMYVLVKSRTGEIGLKLAVGAKPKDITSYHLIEGCAIVVLGGGIGLLITFAITFVLNRVPMTEEVLLYMGRPSMSGWSTFLVVLFLGIIALCAGYFPARRAATIDPAEALRYE
jgi:putative ABC transport system permease protein